MATTVCSQSFSQWKKSCKTNDYTDWKYKFLVKKGTTIASSAAGITLAALQTLVQSETLIPLPTIEEIERDDQEATYTEFGLGRKKMRMEAVRREFNHVLLPLCSHSALRTIDSSEWDILLMDEIGNFIVYGFASDDFRGFSADIDVQNMNWDKGYSTPIHVTYKNASQFDDSGIAVKVDFNGEDVVDLALEEVTLEVVGTPTATEIVVKAYSTCGNTDYPVSGFPITATDFEAGTGTLSSLTEVDGTYTFVTVGLATGTFGLKTPANMTTKGYKGDNTLAITVTT